MMSNLGRRVFLGLGGSFFIVCSFAQLIPVWDGQRILPIKIGSSFVIKNGTLETQQPINSILHNDTLLVYDQTAQGWKLPAATQGFSIKAVMIYVNGLRYRKDIDYTIASNGIVKAISGDNMLPSFVVTCDYWEQ